MPNVPPFIRSFALGREWLPLTVAWLPTALLAASPTAPQDDLLLADRLPDPDFWARLLWWHWLLAILTLVALLGGLLWLLRGRLRVTPPPPSSWVVADAALTELERQTLPPVPYFIRLTDIIRTYCEQRYGVRAAEMTTPEFIRHLSQNPVVPETPRALLAGLLEQADAVKFAHGQATPPQLAEALDRARRFVRETTPAPSPARIHVSSTPPRGSG